MSSFRVTCRYDGREKTFLVDGITPSCALVEAYGEACEYFDAEAQAWPHWGRILNIHRRNGRTVDPVEVVSCLAHPGPDLSACCGARAKGGEDGVYCVDCHELCDIDIEPEVGHDS
jgi:hypothetical protein